MVRNSFVPSRYRPRWRNLPFISPVAYNFNLNYNHKEYSAALVIRGAGQQVNFNPEFGEDETDAYTVFSLTIGKEFSFSEDNLYVKLGVEIFLMNTIPRIPIGKHSRMGRNIFMDGFLCN